jgi:acyl-CoA dehydrogenase
MDNPGRAELVEWERDRPRDFYAATPNLARTLEVHAGTRRLIAMEARLRDFGTSVATVIDPAVATMERHRQFPAHVPRDAVGHPVEAVEFHPAYTEVGREVWGSGILAGQADGQDAFEQAALFYLLTHAGEGGHACPVVCTAGLARALRNRASPEIKARYLPRLLSPDYERCQRGSQFLTEVQGGSDVGANLTEAVPDAEVEGAWRLTGEKWFCSVADADLFAVTARPADGPAGTRGLGCFLVPRHLDDGSLNGFRIRRLKDKLGTRVLATGEIEFDGALAWPIGAIEEGFRIAVEELLDTSRWLNAVGACAIMRRAYLEAASFARHRSAFGHRIARFPLVRQNLARMKVEEQAGLASTMELTWLIDRIDRGDADADDIAWHRLLVNANKYLTSIAATGVVHRAIEALGGNGTIEDFSPLPRLYRDAVVFESWEGTHNVLCAQVQRDCAKLGLLGPVFARLREWLEEVSGSPLSTDAASVAKALDELEGRMRTSIDDADHGAVHFRRQLHTLVRAIQAAALLREAHADLRGRRDSEKPDVAAFFIRSHLTPDYDPEADPDYSARIGRIVAPETDVPRG